MYHQNVVVPTEVVMFKGAKVKNRAKIQSLFPFLVVLNHPGISRGGIKPGSQSTIEIFVQFSDWNRRSS